MHILTCVSPANNKGALNLALKDELAALEWVQANIAHFGGDACKVTDSQNIVMVWSGSDRSMCAVSKGYGVR